MLLPLQSAEGAYNSTGNIGNYIYGGGVEALESSVQSVGLGANISVGPQATALGNNVNATGYGAVAIGGDDVREGSVYPGFIGDDGAFTSDGYRALTAGASGSIAIGGMAWAGGHGMNANGSSVGDVGKFAVALGTRASAYADSALALGGHSTAVAEDSLAMMSLSRATARKSMAMGVGAQSTIESSVALGNASVAATDKDIFGYAPLTNSTSPTESIAWKSGRGAISIGDTTNTTESNRFTRQITGLAAGTQDTDAVNVAQLKSLRQLVLNNSGGSGVHYFSVNSSVTGTGSNYDNDGATGVNALAVGVQAKAAGVSSIAIGESSKADTPQDIAIGYMAWAKKSGAKTSALALGYMAHATDNDTVAIGSEAQAVTIGSTAVGREAYAGGGYNSSAFGLKSNANGASAVALGTSARALATNATALGQWLTASGVKSVAVGFGVKSTAEQSIALGTSTNTTPDTDVTMASGLRSIAIGSIAHATATDAIALGTNAKASGLSSIAFGRGAEAQSRYNIAIGDKAFAKSIDGTISGAVAIGYDARAENNDTFALGRKSRALTSGSTAIGMTAYAGGGNNSAAFGYEANANGASAVALGTAAKAQAANATALGQWLTASGERSVAVGFGAESTAVESIAIGTRVDTNPKTTASGEKSVALGSSTQATESKATALGAHAQATVAGGIALGSGSLADRAAGTAGYDPVTGLPSTTETSVWKSTTAALSIGNATTATATRQITSVAAGTEDTDAVNVAQLKALNDLAVKYDDAGKTTLTLGGAGSPAVALNNVASAGTLSDSANANKAVNAGDVNTALTTLGDKGLKFSANDGTVTLRKLGETLSITGEATTAGTYNGHNIKTVVSEGTVAIQMADSPKFGSVTINEGGKITGLSNGSVTSGSKEAITGDQLNKTNTVVSGNAIALGATYDVATGSYTPPVYNITDASGTPTTTGSVKDALKALNRGHTMTIAATTGGTATGAVNHSVKAGSTVTYTAGRNIELTQDHGTVTIATKNDAVFSRLAIGPVKINEGSSGKITGLTVGSADADAVNVKQLRETIDDAIHANHTTIQSNSPVSYVSSGDNKQLVRIVDPTTGDAKFYRPEDINASTGQPNPTAEAYTGTDIVLAALSGGQATQTTVAVRMKNIDAGIEAHDAVNVTQLKGITAALGGGADVNPDGTIKQPTYTINGVDKNSVGDALSALDGGWTLKATEGDKKAIKAGHTVTMTAGTNMVVTHADGTVTYSTSMTPSFTSVTSDSYKVGANTYIDSTGINANDKVISNVANGTADGHAVNKKQLDDVDKKITDLNSTIGQASAWTLQINGGSDRIISKNSIINFKNGTSTVVAATDNDVTVDLNDDAKASLTKADNAVQYDAGKKSITLGGTGSPAVALNNVASAGTLSDSANANKAVNAGDVNTALTALRNTGLNFAGNEGTATLRKLGETLLITGGATTVGKYNSHNIKTVVSNGLLTLQMADSPKFGDIVVNVEGSNHIEGLANKTLNVAGFATKGRAATEEQLKVLQDSIGSLAGAALTAGDNILLTTESGKTKVSVTSTPVFGTVKVNEDNNGTVTGLTNTTWNGTTVAGRAATEDQLSVVDKKVDGNTKAISDLASTVANNDAGSVKYDKKPDGTPDTSKITLAGGPDGTLLTNLKDGAVAEGSKDAVTGNQLHGTAKSIADIIGGDADVGSDGKVTVKDIGGTGKSTISDAISSINSTASSAMQSWEAQIGGERVRTVDKKNASLNFVAGDNIELSYDGGIKIATAKEVSFDKVTAGGGAVILDDHGITVKDGPVITNKGIDAGNKPITNVGRSTDPNAVATVGQINEVVGSVSGNWGKVVERMHGMDKRISSVGAMAAAFSAMMPLDYDEANPTMFSVGFGHYSGQNAISVGVQHYANRDLLFNGGIAWSNDEKMFRLGATWRMGNSEKYETKRVSTTELKALREVDNLKGTVTTLTQELQEQKAVNAAILTRLEALEGQKSQVKK